MKYLTVILLVYSLFHVHRVFACDLAFIQEPTWTSPNELTEDTVSGLVFARYEFMDGRVLVTVRSRDLAETDAETWTRPPFMFIIIEKGKLDVRYIDREGHGACTDIERY